MSEMVKRVAAAIEAAGTKWANEHTLDYWDEAPLEVYARAAIEAMMTPSKAMVLEIAAADWKGTSDLNWSDGYKIMITAALEE